MQDVRSIVNKAKHLHVELERVTAERESLERQLARFKRRVVELSEQNETVGSQLNTSRGTEGGLRAGVIACPGHGAIVAAPRLPNSPLASGRPRTPNFDLRASFGLGGVGFE